MKCFFKRHHWMDWAKIGPSNHGRFAWFRKCGFCPETQWWEKKPKSRKPVLTR